MIQRTCRLCSKLYSVFDWLTDYFSKVGRKCRQLNNRTSEDKQRVVAVNKECPSCICEKHKMSKYSPSPILDTEKLTRFVFHPVHVAKSGIIKPSVFSHVATFGCSIQRESIASDGEIKQFIRSYLTKNIKHTWYGILSGECISLRELFSEHSRNRLICIYDTSEIDNPAHGEIHQSQYVLDEADCVELRSKLFDAFNKGVNTIPSKYRNGSVL